jgi:hypothetical protein
VKIAHKNLDLSKDNIWQALNSAHFFLMPELIIQCDRFIAHNSILHDLIKRWHKKDENARILDKHSFATKLKFCLEYGLHKNRKILAWELGTQLNKISIENSSILDDARAFTDEDSKNIDNGFNVKDFNKMLHDGKFLRWIWENASDIGILRNAVVVFCADNKTLVESTWPLKPDDLELAIKDYPRI